MGAKSEPRPGEMVVLTAVPLGLLENLPANDQQAILDMVGRPVRLNEYDDLGRAELEFSDDDGTIHFIYVNPSFLALAGQESD